ncbi:MAG TPA: hypothetical protein VGG28_02200 [Kofleriaceae bacterium]|jgi:hypothetical protein
MAELVVFGFRGDALDELRATVELVLGIRMEQRDGDSRGGIYFCHHGAREEYVVLQKNFVAEEQDFAEPAFSGFASLLYVEDTIRATELVVMLEPFARLLRRSDGR